VQRTPGIPCASLEVACALLVRARLTNPDAWRRGTVDVRHPGITRLRVRRAPLTCWPPGVSAIRKISGLEHLEEKTSMKRLMILNGPNLNLLGIREPHIYGTTTLAEIKQSCEQHASRLDLELSFHQSNHEGELVDLIQSARQSADAIIINPAGYSFTSIAILDAIKIFEGPVLEVHISNIHARDEYHRHSKISSVATGVICGLGPYGYIAAMQAIADMGKKS
jgi:3-dehydroquinate dehydratase-2